MTPPKQSRWMCVIVATVLLVLVTGVIIFLSVITGISVAKIREFVSGLFMFLTFYAIARNINKILYYD